MSETKNLSDNQENLMRLTRRDKCLKTGILAIQNLAISIQELQLELKVIKRHA